MKTRRHHADDTIHVVVEPQTSAQNLRVASEGPLPQPVADHHFQREPGRFILGIKPAAQLRLHPQQRKIIRRDRLEEDPRSLR
jgi:hypothetical protein